MGVILLFSWYRYKGCKAKQNKTKQTEKDLTEPELHVELGPKGNVQISYC